MNPLDYRKSHDRRRFYLDRGLRKQGRGADSNLRSLMELPRQEAPVKPESLEVPVMVVGGVAARAYAPERQTKDIDFIVEDERFGDASAALECHGWRKSLLCCFRMHRLGIKKACGKDGQLVDIMSTDQFWSVEAFKTPHYVRTGLRVIPLAYLVLMKLGSARGVDQDDLTRMLGRLPDDDVDAIGETVERHSHDAQAAMTYGNMRFLAGWNGKFRNDRRHWETVGCEREPARQCAGVTNAAFARHPSECQ